MQNSVVPNDPNKMTQSGRQLQELQQCLTGMLPGTLPDVEMQQLPETLQALVRAWRSQFHRDYPKESTRNREAILHWLIGREPERFCYFSAAQLAVAAQSIGDRYGILQQYLGTNSANAQHQLIQTLCCSLLFSLYIEEVEEKLVRLASRTWLPLRVKAFTQKLRKWDNHIRYQTVWIELCTTDQSLRDILLVATLEDYCLQSKKLQDWLLGYLHQTNPKNRH